MILQNSNGVRLIFHVRRLLANFRKLRKLLGKFFKAHPTNLSYDIWNIRPYSWKSYIHQYLGTRTTIMPFQTQKKENRSFRLETAKLVSLSQSHTVEFCCYSQSRRNRIGSSLRHKMISHAGVCSSSKILNPSYLFNLNISLFSTYALYIFKHFRLSKHFICIMHIRA